MPGKRPIEVTGPAIAFFPRPHQHSLRALNQVGVDLVCAKIHFNAPENNPLAASLPDEVVVPFSELPEMALSVSLLFSQANSQELGRTNVIESCTVVILVQLIRHLTQNGLTSQGVLLGLADRKISRALMFMHEEFSKNISLDELAQHSGLSRARFSEQFRGLVGQTPFEYLSAFRVGVAQRKLRGRYPIQLIAAEVGYESVSAFNRVFRKLVGMPPREWRAQNLLLASGSSEPVPD